jgi:hypothetical protein
MVASHEEAERMWWEEVTDCTNNWNTTITSFDSQLGVTNISFHGWFREVDCKLKYDNRRERKLSTAPYKSFPIVLLFTSGAGDVIDALISGDLSDGYTPIPTSAHSFRAAAR